MVDSGSYKGERGDDWHIYGRQYSLQHCNMHEDETEGDKDYEGESGLWQ